MITFKQFISQDNLTEAVIKKWFTTGVDVDSAMSVLNTYAKDGLKAIQNSGLIYRGFSQKPTGAGPFMAMDSSTGKRTSRDTNNLYQLMLASSEALKGYADRGNSFICSTSKNTVADFGDHMFVMVPLDGTNIVMSTHQDYFHQLFLSPIFTGQPDGMYGVTKFLLFAGVKRAKNNDFIDAAQIDTALSKFSAERLLLIWDMNEAGMSIEFKDSRIKRMYKDILKRKAYWAKITNKEFKTFETEIAAGNFTSDMKSIPLLYELFKSNKNKRFTALSTTIMTPKSAGLTLVKYGNTLKNNVECWFSGKCIAISYPVFAQILTRLQEQGFPIHKQVLKDWKSYMKKYGKQNTNLAKDDED